MEGERHKQGEQRETGGEAVGASVSSPKLDHNSVSETVKMKSRLTPLLMIAVFLC